MALRDDLETSVRDWYRPGRSLELVVDEIPGFIVLMLIDGDGRFVSDVATERLAVSRALQADQSARLEAMREELEPELRKILEAIDLEHESPLVLRAMDGDR